MAGGGSGGHVIPALAVARELRARGHVVRFIGTRRGMEAKLVPREGFPIEWIEIGGLKRVGLRKLLVSLAELPWSVWQAARMLRRAAPSAVFSTGGYVAGPVLLAAIWSRVPVVMMEPNAVPGFTHRRLARFAARGLVSFPETLRWFPKDHHGGDRAEVTGLPIREEFFRVPPAQPKPFTVLITGGSQGSRTLNRAAEESWPLLDRNIVSMIHQTGASAFEELAPRFRASGVPGEISAFLEDMPGAFARAHLVVSRAGMGAVSEIAAAGKPSILVPLPTASDQHQLRNAEALEKAGAALLILDQDMTGARLAQEIARLSADPALLKRMGDAVRAFARPGAARRAADILESFAQPTFAHPSEPRQ
jgi:UDP-N-acetylglucosamine--N-acetylmuramyl-(pentapeptide) pyrophosphoryl-undecaprenol N-acetylglucosamine transferase